LRGIARHGIRKERQFVGAFSIEKAKEVTASLFKKKKKRELK